MGSLRLWLCAVALAACGTAEQSLDPSVTGEGGESFTSPPETRAVRLEQTDDSEIASKLSLACSDGLGTTDNSWYRVFSLRDAGISGAFTVNRVNFGVQTSIGQVRVKVSIGTYAGETGAEALDPTKIDWLAMTTVQVPPTSTGEMLQANFAAVEVPPGSNLIVEVHSPGRVATEIWYFYLGSTQSPESSPAYLRAPKCDTAEPTTLASLGHPQAHAIIAVSGTH